MSLLPLLDEIRQCQICEEHLPLGPRPTLRVTESAKILIIGQAPGTKVHASGIPWDDPSGDRLRQWMGITSEAFYRSEDIAIVPMGFCYPGKGKSGDLPPRKECAEHWHEKVMSYLSNIQLTLCIGQYAQNYYIPGEFKTLTDRVKSWRTFLPTHLPLPHPSPRNTLWLKRNPWFEDDVVPYISSSVHDLLSGSH